MTVNNYCRRYKCSRGTQAGSPRGETARQQPGNARPVQTTERNTDTTVNTTHAGYGHTHTN